VPGFARARCHGDGTPVGPGASGMKAAADAPPGVARYRVSRLICGRGSPAGSGSREPVCPACRALAQRHGINQDTLAGPRLGRPAGRRADGCGAQSEYIPVRSVLCDRAQSAGAQQLAPTGRRSGRPVPAERSGLPSRCRASASTSKSASQARLPLVWSSVIRRSWPPQGRNARESPVSQRCAAAGEQHRSQRGPRARRCGRPGRRANGHTARIRCLLVVLPDRAGLGRGGGRQPEQRRHLSAEVSGPMALR